MTKVTGWLTAYKFSLNISKAKYMLNTNKHASTDSFEISVNGNCIERALNHKYLGVIVDEKLTWKQNCKLLCFTISKCFGLM